MSQLLVAPEVKLLPAVPEDSEEDSNLGSPGGVSGLILLKGQGVVYSTSFEQRERVRFTLPGEGKICSSSSPTLSSLDSGFPLASPPPLHSDPHQVMVGASGGSSTQFSFDGSTLREPSLPPGPILNYITPYSDPSAYDASDFSHDGANRSRSESSISSDSEVSHSGKCGYRTFCSLLIIFLIVCTVVLSIMLALGLEESRGSTTFSISMLIFIAFSLGVSVTFLLITSIYVFISSLPSLSSLLRRKNTRLPAAEDHVDV